MKIKEYIPIGELCKHYRVEISFFTKLHEEGLVKITTLEQTSYLHQDTIGDVEKFIRLHQELNINTEGIDAVCNLLQKIDNLENELNKLHNRLRLYESDF
ncbi:chaperone modulator CbpM [uncultured Eudoraea sp.]|uniref:chaperone modulator CbpM n=1 Tax=uncultured Eudoraea sp. TaxID=1035614 RepID=UPI002620D0BE|nr:chaperone modulator CbpM [uncultured Eudoraea sp.]